MTGVGPHRALLVVSGTVNYAALNEMFVSGRISARHPLRLRLARAPRKCARMSDSAWMTYGGDELDGHAPFESAPRFPERWQSGRMYLTRNQAYCKVPWVRIPPSPPYRKQRRALEARFVLGPQIGMMRAHECTAEILEKAACPATG